MTDLEASNSERRSTRIVTIPNVLCIVRLAGCLVLLALALADRPTAFVVCFVLLSLTDWIDGKLAILLDQKTVLGARLDSWADASLYTSLLLGSCWLRGELLWREWPWLTPALVSYGVSTAFGFWKFHRWPSYHTRAAKSCWLLITISAVWILLDGTAWPLRVTMVAVSLTNLEATMISMALPEWRPNVVSLYHALRRGPTTG